MSISNSNSPNFLGQFSKIGNAQGSHSTSFGSYTIDSNGNGLSGTTDKFSMLHSDLAGDGVFTAQVTSVGDGLINPTPDAQGGVMVRSSTDANSAFVAVWTNVDNSVGFQWRTAAGQQASTPVLTDGSRGNKWLRLERKGNVFTASFSMDGSNFTVIGTQTIDLLTTSLFGLFATSGNNNSTEVKFSGVGYTDNSPAQQGMIQVLAQSTVIASASLFADGSYLIPNLPAGSYDIKLIPPNGYYQTSPFYNAISYSNSEYDSANSQLMNSVTVADFDDDGHDDLAYTSPSSSMVGVAYGVGDGTFSEAVLYSAGPGISDAVQIISSGQANSDLWIVDGTSGQVNWLENSKEGRGSQFDSGVGKVFVPAAATTVDIATGQLINESVFGQGIDIGNVPHAGSCCVTGSGTSNTLQSSFGDTLHFQYFEASGDGMITTRLDQSYGIDGGASWVSAGVMIRAGLETGANFASTSIDGRGEGSFPPSYGAFNYRNNGSTQNVQRQTFELDDDFGVRLIKTGNSIQSWVNYVDDSGYKWYLLGEETVELGETFYVGFFASSSAASNSGGPGALNSATFESPSSTFTSSSQAVVSYQDRSGGSDTGFKVIEASVTGMSEAIYTSPSFLYAGDVTVADVNSDGRQDVVMNGGNNLNEVIVAIGNGAGQFTLFTVSMPTSFTNGGAIEVSDVNNDGRRDIVAADSLTGDIIVMLQDDGGGFPLSSSQTSTTVGNIPVGTLELQDVNGDGNPEIVALPMDQQNNSVNIFVSSLSTESVFPAQPLEFSSFTGGNAGAAAIALAVGDFNNDSLQDLITLTATQPIAGLLLSEANPKEETIPVILEAGTWIGKNDFQIRPQAQVSGSVIADNNRNGRIDGADAGLAGAVVFVDENLNGVYDLGEIQAITDSQGAWSFNGLINGSYRIALSPVSGHLLNWPEGDWDSVYYEIEVTENSQTPDNDFLVTQNCAPVISGIKNTGLRSDKIVAAGDDFCLTVTFTDPDGHVDFTTIVDWGDGSESTAITTVNDGLGASRATHVYPLGGIYEINVKIIDQNDDAVVSNASQLAFVTGAGIQNGVLNIVGTRHNDLVSILPFGDETTVIASFLGQVKSFADFKSIYVTLLEGDDNLLIDGQVLQPAQIFGGDGNDNLTSGGGNDEVLGEEGDDLISGNRGNDLLVGGPGNDLLIGNDGNDILLGNEGNDRMEGANGNDVLVGGIGEDLLNGGSGRDLLIGGGDMDNLSGEDGDDIFIGGHTSFDESTSILSSIIAEWSSTSSYRKRIENLRTGNGAYLQENRLVNGLTVHDDQVLDVLDGGTGIDFYFGTDGEIVERAALEGWAVLDNSKPGYTFIYIDTRLLAYGTEGDNDLVWRGGQRSKLELDWFEFPIIAGIQHIDYFAEAGNDYSDLIGTEGDDIFEARPAYSTFETTGYTVTITDSESVRAGRCRADWIRPPCMMATARISTRPTPIRSA